MFYLTVTAAGMLLAGEIRLGLYTVFDARNHIFTVLFFNPVLFKLALERFEHIDIFGFHMADDVQAISSLYACAA